jgi:hypothetical protein
MKTLFDLLPQPRVPNTEGRPLILVHDSKEAWLEPDDPERWELCDCGELQGLERHYRLIRRETE